MLARSKWWHSLGPLILGYYRWKRIRYDSRLLIRETEIFLTEKENS